MNSKSPSPDISSESSKDSLVVKNQKFKRNYRACLNCRVRKVKCDLGSVESPRDGKCARCLRERKDCVFVSSKRGGRANIVDGKRRKAENSGIYDKGQVNLNQVERLHSNVNHGSGIVMEQRDVNPNNDFSDTARYKEHKSQNVLDKDINKSEKETSHESNPKNSGNHFYTMEGALVFLANAAGTIAEADERDNIDAMKKHEQIEARISHKSGNKTIEDSSDSKDSISKAQALSDNETNSGNNSKASSIPAYIKPSTNKGRMSMPPAENGYVVRPKGSSSLSNIEYIGDTDGILSEREAEKLIMLFFTTMHPYFPYIPKFLHSSKVLSGFPILLCAILTISSRYHPFENNYGNGGVPRNIEVHDRLWLYVQRLISQTVWAEASTRSIGTIFAFLLFTEWNPRAIHWRWSDYANKAEDSSTNPNDGNGTGLGQDDTNLAGLGAMRRSYRMGWMLIGSSVRLAQDMGFMEVSSKTFLATHISEINSVMDISRRSMLAYSLSEVDLDDNDDDEDDNEPNKMTEEDEDYDSKIIGMTESEMKKHSSDHPLKFTFAEKAQIELLQIMSLGHESIYGYKAQLGNLSQRQNLSVLNIISPLINNWGRKYKSLLIPSSSRTQRSISLLQTDLTNPSSKSSQELADLISKESFIFEFNYVKLYIYSLALSPTTQLNDGKNKRTAKLSMKMDEISKAARYIAYAFNAANEMLSVAHRVHRLKMLRFMPVRWLTRIVRAVAFIVKCYLTITAHKNMTTSTSTSIFKSENFDSTILSLSLISIGDIVQSIQKAAIMMRDCSPDELHLCTRYSNVLLYLCSEMKTASKTSSNQDDANENSAKRQKVKDSSKENNQEYYKTSYPSQSFNYYDNEGTNSENSTENLAYNNVNYDNVNMFDKEGSMNIPNMEFPKDTGNASGMVGDNELMDWFIGNRDIGLDFVGPWTEMIEQQLNSNDNFNIDGI